MQQICKPQLDPVGGYVYMVKPLSRGFCFPLANTIHSNLFMTSKQKNKTKQKKTKKKKQTNRKKKSD